MSPRVWLQRHLAPPDALLNSRATRWLGRYLQDPKLWHLGRRTVAGGVALGFFLAYVPLPTQMLFGAPLAVMFRVNLPVTMASVWLTNPVTVLPMFYTAVHVGAWATGHAAVDLAFDGTMAGLGPLLDRLWWPFLCGCALCGLLTAAVGYAAVNGVWRVYLVRRWRGRRQLP